ncbi:MAG TPA: DMT family transporter [Chitinophagaceae bacterium]|nr:DMT family transporter [Chitinophagaceae bacterium]
MKPISLITKFLLTKKDSITGIGLAFLAVFIWSGNFIVARDMKEHIPPVSLAFFRWFTASIIITPFAIKKIKSEWQAVKKNWPYLFLVSLTGIALFNTFVYIGGHYTTAINLALIGTTSSPVMAIIMARIFLKEHIGWKKLAGLLLCIAGVLIILCKGNFEKLFSLHFDKGDLWMLVAAFCFAVYNVLVKKRPVAISPISFLSVTFLCGVLMLLPFYLWEINHAAPVVWNLRTATSVLYLGLGASVICFTIWNIAIHKIGAARTVLFGNLIPVFTSIEAVFYLNETFTVYHVISMVLVFAGLLLANLRWGR